MKCYICNQPITGSQWVTRHHPDRENRPDHTETVHSTCHTKYHSANGDFVRWGALSSGAGRTGYDSTITVRPDFHSLGGQARTNAPRDALGRYVKGA